jgi:predicted tellurium resistance membrane protein TerC
MEAIFSFENISSLITLTVMEIVLGIDNIVFISIVAGKLPLQLQQRARITGLSLAMLVRIGLLFAITWLVSLTNPLFTIAGHALTAHDLIMLGGGLFLMYKSIIEIHERIYGQHEEVNVKVLSLSAAVTQIVLLDIVFSFDSILTAIGIAREVYVMIAAVVLSLILMMFFSKNVSDFINQNPTIKMLALAFLLLIGFLLVIEGLPDTMHVVIPKGYLYFAMAFAFLVELLNIRARKKAGGKKKNEPGK